MYKFPLRLVPQDRGLSAEIIRFLVAFDTFMAFHPGYAGVFVRIRACIVFAARTEP